MTTNRFLVIDEAIICPFRQSLPKAPMVPGTPISRYRTVGNVTYQQMPEGVYAGRPRREPINVKQSTLAQRFESTEHTL